MQERQAFLVQAPHGFLEVAAVRMSHLPLQFNY
jgi:hypothetical protein